MNLRQGSKGSDEEVLHIFHLLASANRLVAGGCLVAASRYRCYILQRGATGCGHSRLLRV